ncbi:hypothetical protein KIL84_017842 [Mauremys mutica]|uniref:Uncharacterized protein n=1 Tax=Mauremys mutica TaxID=74926 RepID=A0A9D3X6Y8_9SAUR|nr:hypothetical protein KIL84_017842 [Mauremys mutica]
MHLSSMEGSLVICLLELKFVLGYVRHLAIKPQHISNIILLKLNFKGGAGPSEFGIDHLGDRWLNPALTFPLCGKNPLPYTPVLSVGRKCVSLPLPSHSVFSLELFTFIFKRLVLPAAAVRCSYGIQ